MVSVLMSAYHETSANELLACLESIEAQTACPEQVVLVMDGPIRSECQGVLAKFSAREQFKLTKVPLKENRGLGIALNEGLKFCESELVARMDTDDTCVPARLELQEQYLRKNPDICAIGGAMKEICVIGKRRFERIKLAAISFEDVERKAKLRNPINHPTVMFRKQSVLDAGGYQPFLLLEDYHLWARMLMKGFKVANINEVLVVAGADYDFFRRRGGRKYFCQEVALARFFRLLGFHTRYESLKFLLPRLLLRLLPVRLRAFLYTAFLRKPVRFFKMSSA